MKLKQILIFFIVILFVSYGCEAVPESKGTVETYVNELEPENTEVIENYLYQLEPHLAGIRGVLLDKQNNPVRNVVVRAAVVVWNEDRTEGNFILDGAQSPSTISDDNGGFALLNIIPQEYVLIVGDIEVDPIVIPELEDSNKAKIFLATMGEMLDIGAIIVD